MVVLLVDQMVVLMVDQMVVSLVDQMAVLLIDHGLHKESEKGGRESEFVKDREEERERESQ
jgi:hypothetical protein